jgi:hypothetical protein
LLVTALTVVSIASTLLFFLWILPKTADEQFQLFKRPITKQDYPLSKIRKMSRDRDTKGAPATKGKKSVAIPEKKKPKAVKHESSSPSSSLPMDGMNRAARRRLLKEQGLLVERNVDNKTFSPNTIPARSTYTGSVAVQKQPSQGEKIYACLHSNCNETFEGWQAARNHMMCCKVPADGGEKNYEGKPKISESRRRGNELLHSGVATKKTYSPLPTDAAEIVMAMRAFHSKNSSIQMSGKNSMTDMSFIMRRVIRPQWGNDLKGFSTLGFGTWQEFLDANGMSVEDVELDSNSE